MKNFLPFICFALFSSFLLINSSHAKPSSPDYIIPCEESLIEEFILRNTFALFEKHYPHLTLHEISLDRFPLNMHPRALYRYEFYIRTNINSQHGHLLVNKECHGVHFYIKPIKTLYKYNSSL